MVFYPKPIVNRKQVLIIGSNQADYYKAFSVLLIQQPVTPHATRGLSEATRLGVVYKYIFRHKFHLYWYLNAGNINYDNDTFFIDYIDLDQYNRRVANARCTSTTDLLVRVTTLTNPCVETSKYIFNNNSIVFGC